MTMVQKGERLVVTRRLGYKLHQERPFNCRMGCECGTCDGTLHEYPGTVEQIIYYADNSIEAYVMCDDGERRMQRLSNPSGDVCY